MATGEKGFVGKMKDVSEIGNRHRTTVSYFLRKSKWEENEIRVAIRTESYDYVLNKAKKEDIPMFSTIDDTVNCKTKPSSQAENVIGGAGFHHSHLLRKSVYGHQVQCMMLSAGREALIYDVQRYVKKEEEEKWEEQEESKKKGSPKPVHKSKIKLALEMIDTLPVATTKAYGLTDSWYTSAKIINAYASKGYHFIGAIKTNRIIYPNGVHTSISEFSANHLTISDFDLVTIEGKEYYIYRYEGNLNDIENAVVLLSYPKNRFGVATALKAFICTEASLETIQILEYYSCRWTIEVYFRHQKNALGFDKYQIRSIKGIERFWLMVALSHLFCTIGGGSYVPFGQGLRSMRKKNAADKTTFIYQCAQNNIPIEEVLGLCC